MTLHFATLPDPSALVAICVIVGVGSLIGIGIVLAFGRKLVSNLAVVIKNEMAAQRDPQRVDVQQPLSIQAHVGFTPLDKHNELRAEFERLIAQRTKDVHGLHLKIEAGLKDSSDKIAVLQTAVEVVKGQNAHQTTALADIKTEQADIKREIKADGQAMVNRMADVLTALGGIKGEIKSLTKS